MSNNYDNEAFVLEILHSVLAISEEKVSGVYKVSGIKTSFKSNNRAVTVIGNIAVIDITAYSSDHEYYVDPDSVKYNPDDFELPASIDVTQIGYMFIITGLDDRIYSVDNKSVVGHSPETFYPNILRHHGIHGFSKNHRFMVKLPESEVKNKDDFNPVFSSLNTAVGFRSALYKQNKHKYSMYLEKEIPIYYFDAMSDKINDEDLIEFDHMLSFLKGSDGVSTIPLDIGNHEFYWDGIWLHPEGMNDGIMDSPDKYYHKEVYEIEGKIYQADFLTVKRNEYIIPRGLLAEFLKSNHHVTKVIKGECLFINSLVGYFINFIRDFTGCRSLAEKAYKIQDMLRDGALSSKLLAYHLNLGISDIVNDHGAFTILDNDTREDNDGFYLVPNCMSSYVRPMLPSEGNNDRSVGKVFEPHEAIQLPEGEYVLFKNIYFKRTLAKTEGSYVYKYYPLELMVKYSEIGKYLANSSDENKDTIFPDNKLIYCNKTCGVETPMFNYNTIDEVLTYTDVVTGSESSFKNTSTHIYKIAEGIYGRTDIKYEFTDSTDVDNPLEPFYEYLPK